MLRSAWITPTPDVRTSITRNTPRVTDSKTATFVSLTGSMTGCTVRRDEVNGILIYSDFFTRVSLACEIEGYTGGGLGTFVNRLLITLFDNKNLKC